MVAVLDEVEVFFEVDDDGVVFDAEAAEVHDSFLGDIVVLGGNIGFW